MANTVVNPTRMELTRIKAKLRTARRGHKLLKDKRDELMRQFLDVVRENRALRKKVEAGLEAANQSFTVAAAIMSQPAMEEALLYPKQSVELEMGFHNIMSVDVPEYTFQTHSRAPGDIYPYGYAATSGELDAALENLSRVFEDMLQLAQMEKTAQLLAQEIEKTRRRVNGLEYKIIPDCEDSIKYISMKLDENERASTVRLMKVKDMILKEALEEQKAKDAQAVERFA